MATPVAAGGKLLYSKLSIGELEREFAVLISHVQQEKERVSNNFQQLHSLLAGKEHNLLEEMDEVVLRARHELTEKRRILKDLRTAKESIERHSTENKLINVLKKNLRTLEDKIGEELSRGVSMGWIELNWKKEQLEQSVSDVCEVVTLKERPFRPENNYFKLRHFCSREVTKPAEILNPFQIAIDDSIQNIFVADNEANIIQVFNEESVHLYNIPTTKSPIGIALTCKFIFVSAVDQLLRIRKANNRHVKSVDTENDVWGIDIDENRNIYGCELENKSVIIFNSNLEFLKRVNLTSQVGMGAYTFCIKIYEDNMYIMFGPTPPFHLQIFSLEGELVRYLIPQCQIDSCYFFSIDQFGNIIIADWIRNQIRIFNNKGESIHTITSDMLPGDQKFDSPQGVAINKNNNIIVAHKNKQCSLLSL